MIDMILIEWLGNKDRGHLPSKKKKKNMNQVYAPFLAKH